MKTRKESSICAYGAQILLKHLVAFEKEQAGVHSGDADIEYIHRMRVASRRLRAAMPLFAECLPKRKAPAWLDDVRRITRALGAARDADVQIDALEKYAGRLPNFSHRPGIQRLLLRLRQKRQSLQPKLQKALERLSSDATVAELRTALEPQVLPAEDASPYTQQLYQHAYQNIHTRLEEFLGFSEIVHQPEKVAELHQMRIAAKWLRYTMENFASLYGGELKAWLGPVREMQEQLGDIHDSDVWTDFLPVFMKDERNRMLDYLGHIKSYHRLTVGWEGYLADRKAFREKRYQDFVAFWDARLAEAIWEDLHKQILTPLGTAAVWPPAARTE